MFKKRAVVDLENLPKNVLYTPKGASKNPAMQADDDDVDVQIADSKDAKKKPAKSKRNASQPKEKK